MPTTHGGAAGPYRQELVAYWQQRCSDLQVAVSEGYSLSKLLVSPVELRDWALQGLPTDGVSVDNGTLVTRTHRWPLMIDPQEQGRRWVLITQGQRKRVAPQQLLAPAKGSCQWRVCP
jgi:dynein heavy chain